MTSLTTHGFHLITVIFSSVVLLIGFALEAKPFFESARPKPAVLAARWLLWIGTAGLLLAMGTGPLHPGKSVMFRDTSSLAAEQTFLGRWTAAVFLGISLWRFMAGRRSLGLLVLVWFSAFWLLGAQIIAGLRMGEHLFF